MIISYNLLPYSGAWTKVEAGHLLRRTMFGPSNQQMLNAVSNGLNSTVSSLMNIPLVDKPLSFRDEEGIASIGSTWVTSLYPVDNEMKNNTNTARVKSLNAWIMENINNEQNDLSIAEKMCLFWQNHFGVSPTADARGSFNYLVLLRQHALGNFKELTKAVSINPEMLVFLNGNKNSVASPNENFARELLELFTIGKGPQVGPGDYTNYTEYDISECAKILTGYIVKGNRSSTETSNYAEYVDFKHDGTIKTLSSKFGNAEIQPNGADEYADLLDVIFLQDEVSKHICRKLYRYFVGSEISTKVEDNVISGLSTTLKDNSFEIKPVLEQLFKSEHFYDESLRGCLIKSPLDMFFSIWNGTQTKADYDLDTRYNMYLAVYYQGNKLDQAYLKPTSVAGWPAYYQEPSYTRLWLNASLIKERFDIIQWWVKRGGIKKNGLSFSVEGLFFLNNLPKANNATSVIDNMVEVFLPKGTTASQKLNLKSILTDGLPDFEWTIQYNEYLLNLDDPVYVDPIVKRIKETLAALFILPEFQTV